MVDGFWSDESLMMMNLLLPQSLTALLSSRFLVITWMQWAILFLAATRPARVLQTAVPPSSSVKTQNF
jgi:hypothetical protein